MIEKLGELIGKVIIDRASEKFEELEDALDHLYWWEKDYKIKKTENTIISSGICPIYEKYPEWCEDGCLRFAQKIGDEYGYSVERTKRKPDEEICEFRFEKK